MKYLQLKGKKGEWTLPCEGEKCLVLRDGKWFIGEFRVWGDNNFVWIKNNGMVFCQIGDIWTVLPNTEGICALFV